jgi:hypothetical protein
VWVGERGVGLIEFGGGGSVAIVIIEMNDGPGG